MRGLVTHSLIENNTNAWHGGGVANGHAQCCTIRGNYADEGGGTSHATNRNCLIYRNLALVGGGSFYGISENCTIVSNTATVMTGGAQYPEGMVNTILIRNYRAGTAGEQNYSNALGAIVSTCTTPLAAGTGNISRDPLFTSANADDYHLRLSSPCVDAGANLFHITDDLEGTARPLDGNADGLAVHDMGAFEFPYPELRITAIRRLPGGFTALQWDCDSEPSYAFQVQSSTNLASDSWSPVAPTSQWWITRTEWTNAAPTDAACEFFRVRAQER